MATEYITSFKAAEILFGPTFYPLYKLWHETISEPSQAQYYANNDAWQVVVQSLQDIVPGDVPSTFHFKTFMNWLRLTDRLYPTTSCIPVTTLLVARKCGHSLHPANTNTEVPFCPVCIVVQCCESLARISEAWEKMCGGPTAKKTESPTLYFAVRKVWTMEKVRFANLVFLSERHAELEARYENESPGFLKHSLEDLEVAKSCMEALQVARTRCPYMAGGGDVEFVPGERFPGHTLCEKQTLPSSSRSSSTVRGDRSPRSPRAPSPMEEGLQPLSSIHKHVSFSSPPPPVGSRVFGPSPTVQDGEESRSVIFADDCVEHNKRRSIYWHRNSPHYEPGRHACPSDHGYVDTSKLPGTECDPDRTIFGMKWGEITAVLSKKGNMSGNTDESDSGSDTDSDSDSSDSSVIATVDGENDGSSRQTHHLAENPQGEYGDETLPHDHEDKSPPSLEADGNRATIASCDETTALVSDMGMLGDKEITERAEAQQVKNLGSNGEADSKTESGEQMEGDTWMLGRQSSEQHEPDSQGRDPAEVKRPRTDNQA